MSDAPPAGPRCPSCAAPLVPGRAACAACGLRLVGPEAAELWSLDQHLLVVQRRRAELLAVLAEPLGGPVPAAGPAAPAARPAPRQRRFGAQQLLLVTGVLLVAVAAVAFTTDAWDAIGVLGQAAVLVAVCAGAAAGSRACARRQLTASAEALAVLAVVVLLVLGVAARALDVLGLGATDPDVHRLAVLLLAVALAAAGDRWLRAGPRPVAPAWSAVLLTAALPSVLAAAVGGDLLTWAAAALALAVLSVPAAPLLERRARGLGAAGTVVGAAYLLLGVLALLVVDVDPTRGAGERVGAAVEFALLAGAASWLAVRCGRPARTGAGADGAGGRAGVLAGRPATRRAAVVVAYAGVVGALISLTVAGGGAALLLLALGLAAVAAALLAARPGLLPWPVLVAALGLSAGSLLVEPVVGSAGDTWWRPTAWYALALAAAAAGLRHPTAAGPLGWVQPARGPREGALQPARACWAAAASLAVLGGGLLAPAPLGGPAAVTVAVVAAAALLAASAAVRGAPEVVLVAGWAAASAAAAAGAVGGEVHASVPLAAAGLGALLRAAPRDRSAWAVPGVLLLSVAWWGEVDAVAPPGAGVEWWSLPPALLALAVGALVWQRHPGLGSWSTLGAGLATGLLPSALQAAGEGAVAGGGWRVAVVAVAGAAVCAAGVRLGWQAPVVLGAVAALLVAVGQLGPYALLLPTSVGLFLAGAVVVVLAVRIEQARRDAARAVGWVRALR